MNAYKSCPVFLTPRFTLRLVRKEDAPDLLKVYSDPAAQVYFNADNCTSRFCYTTLEEMEQCIDMWLHAYEQGWFVRWTILRENRPVGTLEMFRRDDGENGEGLGVLRIDVNCMYETADVHEELLRAVMPELHKLFHCQRILTKALPIMTRRRLALVVHGFLPYRQPLVGHNGREYFDYWVRRHNAA